MQYLQLWYVSNLHIFLYVIKLLEFHRMQVTEETGALLFVQTCFCVSGD